ncbi:MAG TPA: YbhB/YbcL family Raf kinase inhibitor-like protein [Terriglobia bacterium]|nr:YbhB/YbcL family Raf kinase inhibitor-like protein [Terriglobia bacterium]
MAFVLRSTSLEQHGVIQKKYTCDGDDISIPLQWSDPPAGTKSFALIADDPDAPGKTWVHWVLYDLPAEARRLPEAVPTARVLDGGARQGINDFRRLGYGGPCPPPGPPHRYVFTLYALDRKVGLEAAATKQDLLRAIKDHTLAQAELVGTYRRS